MNVKVLLFPSLQRTNNNARWLNWRNHRTAEARPRSLARQREEAIFEIFLVTVGLWGRVRSEASQVLRFLPPPFSSPPPFPRYATAANGLDPKVKKSGTFISLM